jgi:hypothetical protein
MNNKFTGYLPTETEILDIAVKFNFTDITELRYGINNAYWQLKIYSYAKRSLRDPTVLLKKLNKCSKDMQDVLSELSTPELSCLEDNYDADVDNFICEIANNVSMLERLTKNTLINVPSAVIIAKKIPVWWFVWELADLWKAEINDMPICNYSIINGYTGKFYRFVLECASLNSDGVYVTGSVIKNVLEKWTEANPMYVRAVAIGR